MARGQNKPNAQLVTTELPSPKPSLSKLTWGEKVVTAKTAGIFLSGDETETLKQIALEPLDVVERIIADNTSNEHAAVYKDGKPIGFRSGSKGAVNFTREELKLFKGTVVTHQHPSGSSFSRGDVLMLHSYKMEELRAVDAVDKTVRSIKPPKDSIFWKTSRDVIADDHNQMRKKYLKEAGYTPGQAALGMVPVSVQVAVINAALDDLDKKYNLGYTRTKL